MEWIVSLTPEAAEDPLAAIGDPPSGASIVEVRLDLFPEIDVSTAVRACPLPILATLRSQAEGGHGSNDPQVRSRIICDARDAGVSLLDLEYQRDFELVRDLGLSPEQTVLSWHDPHGTPESLPGIVERLMESRARWVKVVPTAGKLRDTISVLGLHRRFNSGRGRSRRLLSFAMGVPGLASRYLAPLLGPPIGYVAWTKAAPAAPGQLSIDCTEAVIGHLNGPPQRVYGVVGADVSASLSPVLHAAGYRSLTLPYVLLPISVSDANELADLFRPRGTTPFDDIGLEAHGWAVTTPYKEQAAAAADHRAPRVLRAGAANTLILGEHSVTAENTDADGIVGSLVSLGVDPQGCTALVQGTGGAARGAAVGLYLAGADVVLRGRSTERTRQTADLIGVQWCGPEDLAREGSILVNATPVGREPEQTAVFAEGEIESAVAVVDMVYGKLETPLVAHARELEIPVADGREVLLHQGIAQFAAFTQKLPPKDAMREALKR
jgi:shikimate dehydrogenase/3-dehydroquinate dehydratase type I